MEKRHRRKFSAEFKTKVVLEALKERNSLEEIACKHELHPNQITMWRKEFLAKASSVFSSESDALGEKKAQDAVIEKLYARIGQREVEIDWLKKNCSDPFHYTRDWQITSAFTTTSAFTSLSITKRLLQYICPQFPKACNR